MLHEPAHVLAGNKRYKLHRNLEHAVERGLTGIVSFGGAWSNHVAALAYAAQQYRLHCVCLIRGEPAYLSNPTLSDAQRLGVQFEFVSREQYRQRYNKDWLESLSRRYPNYLILPEGGSNQQAVESCRGIVESLAADLRYSFDVIGCGVGTGATLAGIRLALTENQQARGYLAVQDSATSGRMQQWYEELSDNEPTVPLHLINASSPGYARLDDGHYRWINDWFESTGILLDPVYTVKMVSALSVELQQGCLPSGSRILLVHTGGYQGWRGWQEGERHVAMCRHLSSSTVEEIRRVQCQTVL